MKHYLKSADGTFKIDVEMNCGHPKMSVGGMTADVGCSGECEKCRYSVASCTIPEMLEVLRRADCDWRRDIRKGEKL